jgi:hypothetical protein
MSSSFISEHSAEFILVNDLVKILQPEYKTITPIYYWATREGGNNSYGSFSQKEIKVLAFYPRRPKVRVPGCGTIQVKINELIYHRTQYFEDNGIGVIAGVPLADKLDAIHSETPCLWFEIGPMPGERIFEIELESGLLSGDVPRTLDKASILTAIERHSQIMEWPAVIKILKKMGNRGENRFTSWNRMSGDLYKPIYLLLHLNKK